MGVKARGDEEELGAEVAEGGEDFGLVRLGWWGRGGVVCVCVCWGGVGVLGEGGGYRGVWCGVVSD